MQIAIVGAGPAGAMAAVRLARAGADVAVFDPSHPREKPCGGGLTGRALDLVADVVDIARLPAVVTRFAHIESPDESAPPARVTLQDRGLTPASSLVVVSRAIFDAALTDAAIAAGARLIREKVADIARARHDGRFIVRTDRTTYAADIVLGADGANSIVRKTLAAPFSREHISIAAGFFVRGITSDAIDIKPMREQPGYLWSFPRSDHLAVGVCAPASGRTSSSTLRHQTAAWIHARDLDRGTRLHPYAWPIPSIGFEARGRARAAGPGWMLLGDAAGLVDPLTREGIYYALLSGARAAQALISYSSDVAARRYRSFLNDEVHPELRRAAARSRMFFTPAFASLFVEALAESDPIRRVFVDLVGGTQPYRGLRRRLLRTCEWKLAGRAIRLGIMPAFAGTMIGEPSPRASNTA